KNSILNINILCQKHLLSLLSQYVPKTCQCPQVKQRVKGLFSDFKVTLKGPNFTRQKNNSLVCLSPDGPQGKRLLKCCMQKDGKDSKKCIRRQKQKPRRRNRKQVKSRKVKQRT
uniref:Chemokine interleukin-8-like domain-containing protein n=1 Tax=Sinocyclocheilus anshuiensis TaxID=1608454 RepID=A0A671QIR3_9TELE